MNKRRMIYRPRNRATTVFVQFHTDPGQNFLFSPSAIISLKKMAHRPITGLEK